MNTASNTASLIPISTRCSHRTPSGRLCRHSAADPQSGLCQRHSRIHKQSDTADLTKLLVADWKDFQTAQGINFTLGSLYKLLAANRISARRAAVLAYIASLLLRTHPAIDSDRESGIESAAFASEPKPTEDPSRQDLGQQAAKLGDKHQRSPDKPFSIPEPDPAGRPS